MSIARVQSAQNIALTTTTTLTATFGTGTTAGNLIVAAVARPNAATISGVASGANSFTQAVAVTTQAFVAIYYLPNAPSGLTGITLTLPTADSCIIQVVEYSGCAAASPLDKTASHDSGFSPAGTSWSSGATSTLSQTGELIVGVGSEWRSITTALSSGTGFNSVLVSSNGVAILEDILNNATTTGIAATGTATTLVNGQVYSMVATFLPAPLSGVPSLPVSPIFIHTDDIFWKAT